MIFNLYAVIAWQFTDESKNQIFNNVTCNHYADFDEDKKPILRIQTPEGTEETAHLGDWVIKVAEGQFYIISDEKMKSIKLIEDSPNRPAWLY